MNKKTNKINMEKIEEMQMIKNTGISIAKYTAIEYAEGKKTIDEAIDVIKSMVKESNSDCYEEVMGTCVPKIEFLIQLLNLKVFKKKRKDLLVLVQTITEELNKIAKLSKEEENHA